MGGQKSLKIVGHHLWMIPNVNSIGQWGKILVTIIHFILYKLLSKQLSSLLFYFIYMVYNLMDKTIALIVQTPIFVY